MEISFCLLWLVKDVVKLVLQYASIGGHNCGSIAVKIPMGNTPKEKNFIYEFTLFHTEHIRL